MLHYFNVPLFDATVLLNDALSNESLFTIALC